MERQVLVVGGKNRGVFLSIQILAVIGILLAVYLLWEQFSHSAAQLCTINSAVNCDAIISGPIAQTLGIPTPLYGLIGYIIIVLSALWSWKKLLVGTSAFGLIFCLWIAYQEVFQLHVICPVCIGCQLLMVAIFALALYVRRQA